MDGDEQLKDWINLYAERLIRLAYSYTGGQMDAEDRVQDALIKGYRSIHQLVNPDNPFPWLVRIVINECRLAHRKKSREILMSVTPDSTVASTEETYFRITQSRQMYRAVLALPEKYRLPVVLYHFEELPVGQVAEILRINPETVKTRLARARKRLMALLEEDEFHEDRAGAERRQTSMS